MPAGDEERPGRAVLRFGKEEWRIAYGAALRVLRVPDRAEDAAQTAMLRAFRARDRFEGRSSPASWIHRIATNVALTDLRSMRRRVDRSPLIELDLTTVAAVDPRPQADALVAADQLRRRLQHCLDDMELEARRIFSERYLRGDSANDVARRLGITDNAAKQRAFRARRFVRRRLTRARE